MKKILGLLIALIISTKAFASLTVMPTRIEANANKTRASYISTAIEIKGDSKEIMRFKVYPGFFTINDKAEFIEVEKGNDPHDISKKIKFVPSEFTVLPGKSQKVRINIVGINSMAEGENRAVLYVEDINPKEFQIGAPVSGIGAQLIVKSRVGIPIYVDKGNFTKKAEIGSFNVVQKNGGQYLDVKIVSTGSSKIRYNSYVQYIKDTQLVKEVNLGGGVVGGNNSYVFNDKLDFKGIESGEYVLRFILTYMDEKDKKQTLKEEKIIQIKGEM